MRGGFTITINENYCTHKFISGVPNIFEFAVVKPTLAMLINDSTNNVPYAFEKLRTIARALCMVASAISLIQWEKI